MCFTNYGEALYLMSSSELQRISLSATKVVSIEGTIDLVPLNENEEDEEADADEDEQKSTSELDTTITESTVKPLSVSVDDAVNAAAARTNGQLEVLTNGVQQSPNNGANDTITSSVGDLTLDSVRDHLNSTITTIHSTTTEEIVGKFE